MIRIVVEVSEDANGVGFEKYVQACGLHLVKLR